MNQPTLEKNAQLMAYVRYESDMDLEEEFLFCTPLTTMATGADIFSVVDNFQQEGIIWQNCVSLCTDGAPAMLGARHGFTARVRQINSSVQVVHCLLHRENLVAQHLSPYLSAAMKEVVGVVNLIKASAVNSRLFEQLCVDNGSQFKHLVFYSNVKWLSCGTVSSCAVFKIYEQKCRSFSMKKIIEKPFGFKMESGCSKYVTQTTFSPH